MKKAPREIPLRYDDGFRGGTLTTVVLVLVLAVVALDLSGVTALGPMTLVTVACAGLGCFFVIYLVWTHLVFSRTEPADGIRIAAAQYQRRIPVLSRLLGFDSTQDWVVSAAAAALAAAIAAAIYGAADGGAILMMFALLTAAGAWATVAYAFALRYFRMHAAGERFSFGALDDPGFGDFLTLSLMISSAGSLAAAEPSTRAGLRAVRTHSVIAFVFNAIVVAMTVSLLAGLISAIGA